ncbi:LOW QUALITY PROTEIN: hypothetical protein TorRG33x02_134030 [Trema orientale]|uniref:Uncharacterized protein n=1 Tax=Trema orientale TaxID=63057 RepID=A0A2P5EYZ9_TREOI|nr:LOW QUALITY PROTEIN: hypothetical protein TorRG33x02_134030 [Trema orientale]
MSKNKKIKIIKKKLSPLSPLSLSASASASDASLDFISSHPTSASASHIYKITPNCLIYGGTERERVRRRDQKLASASTAELSIGFELRTNNRSSIYMDRREWSEPHHCLNYHSSTTSTPLPSLLVANHSFYSSLRTILFLYIYVFVYVLVYV